jgi:hypothetical protein
VITRNHIRELGGRIRIWEILLPILISVLFLVLSRNEISVAQWILAMLLLQAPWLSYRLWKQQKHVELPLFAIVAFMYWVFYALPLFWGARTVSGIETPFEQEVSTASITLSLELCTLGVAFLWLGMKVGLGRRVGAARMPHLRPGPLRLHYLRLLLIAGSAFGFLESFPYMLGAGGQQLLAIAVSVLPLVAFIIMFRSYLRGESSNLDKMLIIGFLALRFVTGVASGWLGAFASIIVVCVAVYICERKKVPKWAVILIVSFTLFFQVGKQEFRRTYWRADTETSKIDRVTFWTETSLNKWGEALSDPSGATLKEALGSSVSRVSLLTQTANVVDLTPSVVPYQYWNLYSYMAITWVPRFLWPDKPSANEANQFYQLAYGLGTEESIENTSMAVGIMTEGYISFGWTGVICVMLLMGILLDIYQNIFFRPSGGPLMTGIGIALLPQILTVESQLAVYMGGLAQQVLFILVVMWPIIRFRGVSKPMALSSPLHGASAVAK